VLKVFLSLMFLISIFSTTAWGQSVTIEQLSPSDAAKTPEYSENLSLMSKVYVKNFRFTGNTVFTSAELRKLAFPYENREITFEELERLRQELSLYYINKGYLNSGVIIPDQKVVNGSITLTVIEGKLNQIEIEGLKHFRKGYITSRLANAAETPVNIGRLQEALQLLQQDPRIKRINAEFKPSSALGEGGLEVKIEEASPYMVLLAFNNDAAPSTGAYRGELGFAHQNLLGYGDILAANFGLTEGTKDVNANYTTPVNSKDTALGFYYRTGDSIVIEPLFDGLDIKSESTTYGFSVRQPLKKTFRTELALSFAAEVRQSRTSLLGRGFSFSPGADEGKSKESVIRFSQEWLERTESTVFAAHSTFSLGIDAFGATVHDSAEADGRFVSWLGQTLLIKRVGESASQFVLKADMQLANDSLLSIEKFSLGGMNRVRGYRKDLLVRDNGLNSSAEFRMPVLVNGKGGTILQIVPFFDFGWAWNNKTETPEPRTIYSIGLGLKWNPIEKVNLDLFYGQGLRKISNKGDDLQDRGLHFLLSWQVM